ncbi:flagellar hook-associated protein 2 [Melaminivora alkalimesophila]|uniref:Flagellar hook-associated protein 2 n=3 Tax=Melaminivora alkalimesophila TaxID=1165852 RepID=A0A317R8N0_9BURK|nr:flagellar filament capping protein FliD [Melaminivora alkalimesophila]PWW44454.1 flagellar hook-associated protein 2 [Melaminivora alkalimesophila]
MASISSPGVGSGLDINAIVGKMMAIEQRPLQQLQTKAGSIETKISSYGQIKAALSSLYDAANALMNSSTWQSKQFTSADKSTIGGSASAAAGAGSFAVQVDRLASSQALASGSFGAGAAVGVAGQLSVQSGRWDAAGSTFAGTGSAVSIEIAADDTLADIAGKINAADAGVSAVVVRGTHGEQLLVRGSKTGADNGFALSVQDADGQPPGAGSALARLAYDQASIQAGSAGMVRSAAAGDAVFSINGIAASSPSNTAEDVVPGLKLELLKTTSAPVEISVAADRKAVRDKIEAFQQAYNRLNALVAELTRYDAASKKAQPLQGDGTAVNLHNALRGLVGQPGASGSYLSDLGLQVQRDGSLGLDAAKLEAALADLPKLEQTLTASTGDAATNGLVTRIRDFAFQANGVNGSISGRSNALQAALKRNATEQDDLSTRLAVRQQNLLRQYQTLDANMASLSSLSSFMAAQVSRWNKS